MNGNGHKPPEWIPPATLVRLEAIAREFIRLRTSGYVTVVLHFRKGEPMPSELSVHERSVVDAGPADILFSVRR